MTIVEVLIDTNVRSLDRTFTYYANESLYDDIKLGSRVIVPFGKGNKKVLGLVISKKIGKTDMELKEIFQIVDRNPIISEELLTLATFVRDKYLSTFNDAIHLVMPPGRFNQISRNLEVLNVIDEKDNETVKLINSMYGKGIFSYEKLIENRDYRQVEDAIDLFKSKGAIREKFFFKDSQIERKIFLKLKNPDVKIPKNATLQLKVIDYLKNKDYVEYKLLRDDLKIPKSVIDTLIKKEVIISKIGELDTKSPIRPYYEKKILNKEQEAVYTKVVNFNRKGFLLHGVTGSGKTEVYLKLTEFYLSKGKSVIILVPEIALTPQMIDRFEGRFEGEVAVLHSKMTPKERLAQWVLIKNGEKRIVVGARSAVFAPLSNLGLIIIDEEHESSFKSNSMARFETFEVAKKRVDFVGGKLLLGSATPNLTTYYKALNGELELLELKNRISKTKTDIEIVDMAEEYKSGNTSIISRKLYNRINEALKDANQVILFLNRKGYSGFISCKSCGHTEKCEACDISMTYYKSKNLLKCNYCGRVKIMTGFCSECNSNDVSLIGLGTELVEEVSRKLFPQARIRRMDMETTKNRESYEEIYRDMLDRKIDILIGTQMVSKGFDFPHVTLMGVLLADLSLNIPDFHASERTFQLISQSAGRAGRDEKKGHVIVQSFNPKHYSVRAGAVSDYELFYKNELKIRKQFNYPPFKSLILIGFSSNSREAVINLSKEFAEELRASIRHKALKTVDILGPNPSSIEKIKGRFRHQIIVKTHKDEENLTKHILEWVYNKLENKNKVRIIIDVNPNSII
ncbi:MAG: primosomal protein N' [Tissierellia bacterium]|nr:primosomal protein N' [Tissierellia bacterium]